MECHEAFRERGGQAYGPEKAVSLVEQRPPLQDKHAGGDLGCGACSDGLSLQVFGRRGSSSQIPLYSWERSRARKLTKTQTCLFPAFYPLLIDRARPGLCDIVQPEELQPVVNVWGSPRDRNDCARAGARG